MSKLAALFFLLPGMAFAAPAVVVEDPWSPPSMSQTNAVGFMKLTSPVDDVLLRATSDCCTAVELHTHQMDGDVIRMRRVENIPLPAGEQVMLRPGGYHLMLIGLKKPLTDGATQRVTLHFEHAEAQDVTLEVSKERLLQRMQSGHDGAAHSHH